MRHSEICKLYTFYQNELKENILNVGEQDSSQFKDKMEGVKEEWESRFNKLAYYIEQFEQSNEVFFEQIQTYFESVERYEEAKQWIELLAQLEQQVQNYYQVL